jgi:hypothetical protein
MGKIPPKNTKKEVKTSKITSIKAKIYHEIRKICKKYPKIKKKIKNIKDLDKRLYYARVWYHTEQQPLHILENNDKRGWKGHHLDHIYPISAGYTNNIPPEKIGNIKNLQFIHHEDNMSKGSTITTESKNALRRIKRLK